MQKRVWILISVMFVVVAGGFLAGRKSFSEYSPSESAPLVPSPLETSPFKMSGVITSLDFSDPNHLRLTIRSESGVEKTLSISENASVVLEGKPVTPSELKTGDVIDIDCEFDAKTEQPFVQRAAIIVRATPDQTVQDHSESKSKDPEFE